MAEDCHTTRTPHSTAEWRERLTTPGQDGFAEYLAAAPAQLAALLDFDRPGTREAFADLSHLTTEFDSDHSGRGDSYRRAQTDTSVRWTGMRQLLRLAANGSEHGTLLDVLGGDGTIAAAATAHGGGELSGWFVITSDRSAQMVDGALRRGLPAVRQDARFLFLKDSCVDAVLSAYGTHHIPVEQRGAVFGELARVVRPGGRVVVHDFDAKSPMAHFFTEVVDRQSWAGHDYEHFSRASMLQACHEAGLQARIEDIYDPFVVRGDTLRHARDRMCTYIGEMYGIADYLHACGPDRAWSLLMDYFDHSDTQSKVFEQPGRHIRPTVWRQADGFVAEVPRCAMVAVAEKE